jgi:hypothetical protein
MVASVRSAGQDREARDRERQHVQRGGDGEGPLEHLASEKALSAAGR